jgi:hypothetical protein
MSRKVCIKIKLDCAECPYYRYIRCYGNDCFHPKAPQLPESLTPNSNTGVRGDEPLAENRKEDVPKWCPLTRAPRRTLRNAIKLRTTVGGRKER